MYNKAIEDLEKEEDQRKVQSAYYSIFNTPEGQVVLEDLMHAHYITGPAIKGSIEYCEAQRNVVLRIMALSRRTLTLG